MSSPPGIWPNDKRREPRHFFVATVELFETDAHAGICARTGDLSMNGCYVDIPNPFPVQSKVKVTITHNEESFISPGTIAHAERTQERESRSMWWSRTRRKSC